MNDDFVVLVGRGAGGQEAIVEAVRELGIKAEKTDKCCWPRDDYVCFKRKYVTSHANGTYNPLGDGGNVRAGDGFMLVSDYALWLQYGKAGRTSLKEIWGASIDAFEGYFPGTRLWVAPTGLLESPGGCEHIDLFSLLCPKSGILVLDTHYGKAANHKTYDLIAEMEELKIIRYDGSQDGVRFPLNASVLPVEDEADMVLLDDKSKTLIHILRDEGINTVGITMSQMEDVEGKIDCQTNLYFPSDGVKPQDLLRIF